MKYRAEKGYRVVEHLVKHNQRARRALWLLEKAQRKRSIKKLTDSRGAFESVLEDMSPDHPDRPACLSNLGTACRLHYQWEGDTSAIDQLLRVNELITQSLPEGHRDRLLHRRNLQYIVADLVLKSPHPGLLIRVVPLAREAAADPVHRPVFLEPLVACLQEQFDVTEDPAVLVELISVDRERIESVPVGDPEGGAYLGDLGMNLRTLALLTGQPQDLEEAVGIGRQAVDECPSGHEHRAMCLINLGNSLHALFVQQDRSMATLHESIAFGRQAVAAAPDGHPHRSACLTGLGIALRTLFEETRELDALHEAAQVSREAVDKAGPDKARRSLYLGNLSAVHQELFKRTGNREAIEKAVTTAVEAVELSPVGTRQRANRLSDLGNALHILAVGHPSAAPEDSSSPGDSDDPPPAEAVSRLRSAIEVARQAVEAGPQNDVHRGARLSNLSVACRTLFEVTGDTAAIEEAVRAARDGVAASAPETTARAAALLSLVRALAQRPDEPHVLREIRRCCEELETAAAAPRTRVIAQLHLGRAAMEAARPDAETALAAYEKAISWLPEIAPRHLRRPDREHGLNELAGLPAEAASVALELGRPEHALLLLEHSRGLLLRESMGSRGDLGRLRRADPEAADEFVRLRDLLNASDQSSADMYSVTMYGGVPASVQHGNRAERHRELARQWEELLNRIRRLPGLTGFLLPPTLDSLRGRLVDGPIVLVNASPFRCDALVLDRDAPVRALRLDCGYIEVRERARGFQTLRPNPSQNGAASPRPAEREVLDSLAWLWDHIGEPVLADLGLLSPSALPATDAPRIWWCPIGVAAFLPLHAAGRHYPAESGVASAVLDHVVSSYTSTVSALQPDHRHGAAGTGAPEPRFDPGEFLLVEASDASGADALTGARLEAEFLAELVRGLTRLHGQGATPEAVLEELPRHSIAHFACHAVTDARSPSLNRLVLHDRVSAPLTAIELSALDVQGARLAYLSSCETVRSSEALADEAVHIGLAFQLAGYRHVIGTLWRADDGAAGRIADGFYTALAPSFDTDSAARHLHRAVCGLRADAPQTPSRWAAHIHLGH